MIRSVYKARAILDTFTTRHSGLRSFSISETEWRTASSIGAFIQTAAFLIEFRSESRYATLGMTIKAFKALATKCQSVIDEIDIILKQVSEKMLVKLHKHIANLCKRMSQLARVLNSRFGDGILSDSEVLRCLVNLPIEVGNEG